MIDLNKLKPRDIIKFRFNQYSYVSMFYKRFNNRILVCNIICLNDSAFYRLCTLYDSKISKPSQKDLKQYTRAIKKHRLSINNDKDCIMF